MTFSPGGTLVQGTEGFSKDDLQLASYVNTSGTVAVRVTSGTANPVPVTLQTLIAGEDLTNDVLKTENRYSYTHVSAVGTTVIKNGAGFLHSINVGVSSTGGQIVAYDNATGTSATRIAVIGTTTTPEPLPTYIYDVSFANGLVVANVGTQTYTVSFR